MKVAAAFFGEEQLILRTSEAAVFNKEASAERRQKAAQRGYDLEDTRRDLKPAIADYSEELRTLQRPGVHRVMDAEGNTVRVRAFHAAARSIDELTRRENGANFLNVSRNLISPGNKRTRGAHHDLVLRGATFAGENTGNFSSAAR